jgi:hypothetical protein
MNACRVFASDPHWDAAQRVTQLVVELLTHRGHSDEVIISSFGPECIDEVGRICPQLKTAQLLLSRRPTGELLDDIVARRHSVVHPYDTMVDAAFKNTPILRMPCRLVAPPMHAASGRRFASYPIDIH